jgi:uncharacterized protein (TIGR02118 family)
LIVLKRLTIWHCKSSVDHESAVRHWLGRHVELVLAVPGVKRYTQNACVPGPDGSNPPYTGLGEVWFDSIESATAAVRSVEWQAVIADADTFMDMTQISAAWAEEHLPEVTAERPV